MSVFKSLSRAMTAHSAAVPDLLIELTQYFVNCNAERSGAEPFRRMCKVTLLDSMHYYPA
jgi:hypothetical protein